MTHVDFTASRKAAEQEGYISGGDTFKFKDGPNRLRLLSECLPHPGTYNGRPTFKWLCYVIDRDDTRIKLFFMPHSIYKQIEALQKSEDYTFDAVPMPYDVTVNAKGAGTKEVEYTVVPARTNKELTTAETAAFAEKKPLREVQAALKAKSVETPMEQAAADHFDPESVPNDYPATSADRMPV